jgi:hypothetical protein
MAANLTRLTHKITIQLHLVAESCTICSSRSKRPVRKLLDTPSYTLSSLYVSVQKGKVAIWIILLGELDAGIYCSYAVEVLKEVIHFLNMIESADWMVGRPAQW